MKNFLFGTAYYDEYMPYDRLLEDMKMMKKMHINVIRIAESTWSTLEPENGTFDFSHIDRVLNAAKENNISVIIGTPTYAVPPWLVRLDENVLATTKNGKNKYGWRQLMDITNETYLKYSKRVIEKLVSHTANNPIVIGFQIDNETKHYDTSSKEVQKSFVEYLKNRFKTTEKMNDAFGLAYWSNSINKWDDFPDIRGVQNGSLACAFETFQRELVNDFIKMQVEIVNKYKRPDQFITHNFDMDWKPFGAEGQQDGYSRGLQPNACHFDMDKYLTVSGVDVYHPTQDKLTGAEIAFAGAEIRALKDKPYIVLETEAQGFAEFLPYPNQARLQAFANVASGATGVMYWNWHSIHNGIETYWKGILSHDLKENPTYLELCKTGAELEKLSPVLTNLKKKNKVALLVDNESLTALKKFPIHKDLSYNDVIVNVFKSLYELNIECDIVYAKSLDFEKYDLIIAPVLYSVNENVSKALKNYVANGGTLVSTFKSFVTDENIKVSTSTLPSNMNDVFGIEYNQFTRPVNTCVNGSLASYFMELITPTTAKTIFSYDHKVWKNYSAITENKYKKGCAFYIGYYPDEETLKSIILLAAENAGIKRENAEFPIIVKNADYNGKNVKFVLNFSDEETEYICNSEKTNLLNNKKYIAGEKVHLGEWDVALLLD